MQTSNATVEPGVQFSGQDDFSALLNREFKPKTELARVAVEAAVRTLAEQALANTVVMSDDAYAAIESVIAEIDRKLTEQINLILHHEDFQKIESAWRGLHHLVANTETDEQLKVRFMDLSKDEMRRTLRRHKGVAWDQSPIFKRVYEEEYGQLGGEPYGCLVADYYFDHTPPDVELLGAIAKVSASAQAFEQLGEQGELDVVRQADAEHGGAGGRVEFGGAADGGGNRVQGRGEQGEDFHGAGRRFHAAPGAHKQRVIEKTAQAR